MKNIVVALAALAGCASGDEVPSLDIVAARRPVITSVATDDGFTQVRQSATAALVIRGKKLGKTTSVTVGPFSTTLDSVTARTLRVTVFTGPTPLGPLDVTVTSPSGSITAPGAIELTPFVVSPTAVTGHGTFQSPINLCAPELEFTGPADVVQLLAGTHRCGHPIFVGAGTVQGDPEHATVLTGTDEGGFGMFAGGFAPTTAIRDLTFAPPLAEWSIVFSGELDVQRVVDAGGILGDDNSFVTLDQYTYEGEGTALNLRGAQITQTTIRHCGPGGAIELSPSSSGGAGASIDGVLVEDCDVGVSAQGVPFGDIGVEITNSQFIAIRTAVVANHASTTIRDTVIRGDASVRAPQSGVGLGSGLSFLSNVEITGMNGGLGIFHGSSDNHEALVHASGLEIVGGLVGISIGGIDNQLTVRNSIVRDQTVASLLVSNVDGVTNFGTASDPGNNQLSVISGFAIDDFRFTESSGRNIRAVGTTLNGVSFAGQTISGPAELAPFYRFAHGGSGIQF
jgi:hypothetical protein